MNNLTTRNIYYIENRNLTPYELMREIPRRGNMENGYERVGRINRNNRGPVRRIVQILETDIDDSNSTDYSKCLICDAPSSGFHFNAPSCSACAAYFRRTVTLNRVYICQQNNNCRVFYGIFFSFICIFYLQNVLALRVICKACRFKKCLEAGMERSAVQPRRECNFGRRKFAYRTKIIETTDHIEIGKVEQQQDYNGIRNFVIGDNPNIHNDISNRESQYYDIPSQKIDEDQRKFNNTYSNDDNMNFSTSSSSSMVSDSNYKQFDYKIPFNTNVINNSIQGIINTKELCPLIDDLVEEEKKTIERRGILFCSKSKFNQLFKENDNILSFDSTDLRPMKFAVIRKELRSLVLVTYEWIRSRKFWKHICAKDRICLLKRTVLHHTILDPAFLTAKIGYPSNFIMSNGMYISTNPDKNIVGWEDESEISCEMKKNLYMSLMNEVIETLVIPLRDLNITSMEYIFLKALVSWKNCGSHVLSTEASTLLDNEVNELIKDLYKHYENEGMCSDDISSRMGNILLLIGNIYTLGMHTIESHVKISFFDLWELDSMILKLFQ
uniref:Nuclear receptor domain-containing protein n=1 Tax=Parastrongyloides trichosuri TaxID=131310 RepID=A0A0N4ZF70_PARTI